MRDRISKAKAFIAVRNYNAAIYELESIRRESSDPTVQSVVSVLLMNSYLEQGDYKRATDFLNDFYAQQKTTKPGADANYFAVAGQIVKGARNRIERYRALGLSVSDRTLPLEAVNDIEKMREVLELVITQTKEVGKVKTKTSDAMALLEEAANSRSMMARDDYDARRWRDEVSDTREQVASSRSVVLNAVNDGTGDTMAQNAPVSAPQTQAAQPVSQPVNSAPVFKPVADITKPSEQQPAPSQKPTVNGTPAVTPAVAQNKQDNSRTRLVPNAPVKEDKPAETSAAKSSSASESNSSPIDVGSLVGYATKQSSPVYPVAARTMRTTGVVKVEVTVDENGEVTEVQHTTGPSLLQTAARDAVRKWKFKPFTRDGQPVKATGFVNFNFTL
jgi:protein TonB